MEGNLDPHNVALGRAIRRLREDAGHSQQELATRAQLTVAELNLIEAGGVDADWGTLRRIASGLGTSLADVFRLPEFDHAEEQQQDQGDHGGDE